jgi:hypothetical protein
MSPTVANGLLLSFTALLTLLLILSLIAVIKRPTPTRGPLNQAAGLTLARLKTEFEDDVRRGASTKARALGRKEISNKDIRAAYRARLIRKAPRAVEKVTRYGGITISAAGVIFALPALPNFPPQSPSMAKLWGGAAALVAAIAIVFDGTEFFRDTVERRHKSKNRISTSAGEHDRERTQTALPFEPASKRAEEKLQLRCERLAQRAEKEARRLAGDEDVAPDHISTAWWTLVRPRAPATAPAPATPAVRSRKGSILRSTTMLVATLAVAAFLYFIFSLVKTKLPTGQYWPAVVIIAALYLLYLVLVNSPRVIAAAWKRCSTWLGAVGTLASGLRGGLFMIARKGRALVGSLVRIRRREGAVMPPANPPPANSPPARANLNAKWWIWVLVATGLLSGGRHICGLSSRRRCTPESDMCWSCAIRFLEWYSGIGSTYRTAVVIRVWTRDAGYRIYLECHGTIWRHIASVDLSICRAACH